MFALLIASLAALSLSLIVLLVVGWFFDRRRPPPSAADVALVFGCGTSWKSEARLRRALELFKAGVVPQLIVSGGVKMPDRDVTEAEWFRDWLLREGVPADRIHLENLATNTAENAAFSWPLLEQHGWRRVVLVMSDFEGVRAHLTAKRAWLGRGVTLYDCHAASPGRWHRWTWWLSREGWRLTAYTWPRLFRYGLLPYLWRR